MSRELDAEVAESVMGWWSVGIDTSNMLRSEIWADGKRKIYGFNPSQNIEIAFEVLNKIVPPFDYRRETPDWKWEIVYERESICCRFTHKDGNVFEERSESVCEAICKAALSAKAGAK